MDAGCSDGVVTILVAAMFVTAILMVVNTCGSYIGGSNVGGGDVVGSDDSESNGGGSGDNGIGIRDASGINIDGNNGITKKCEKF
jgi:hypothetical protein